MTTTQTPSAQQTVFTVRANKSQLISLRNSNQWPEAVEFESMWHDSIDTNGRYMLGFMSATYSDKETANQVYENLRKLRVPVTRNWLNDHAPTRPNITGVLTSEEAFQRAKVTNTLVAQSFHKSKAFFFSDHHCSRYNGIDQDSLVPSTMVFPMSVTPRDGLENGVIDTIEKYIFVFRQDSQQLSSLQEVLDYIKLEEDVDVQFYEPVFAPGETYESYMTDVKDIVFDIAGIDVTFDELEKDVDAAFEKAHYSNLMFSTCTVRALLDYIKTQHEKPTSN